MKSDEEKTVKYKNMRHDDIMMTSQLLFLCYQHLKSDFLSLRYIFGTQVNL